MQAFTSIAQFSFWKFKFFKKKMYLLYLLTVAGLREMIHFQAVNEKFNSGEINVLNFLQFNYTELQSRRRLSRTH